MSLFLQDMGLENINIDMPDVIDMADVRDMSHWVITIPKVAFNHNGSKEVRNVEGIRCLYYSVFYG